MTDLVQNVTTTTRVETTVRFGGFTICTDGFDDATFAAAIARALHDGLTISPGRAPRTWLVTNPLNRSEYVTNAHGCSCRAGEHGTPCKHRAIILVIEAILGGSDSLGGAS